MAKKKVSFARRLEDTVGDMANAVTFAATGVGLGTVEMALEEDLRSVPKPTVKKKAAAKKARKPVERNQALARRKKLR